MIIGLGHYLAVAAILFTLGIFGIFLNRKNVIVILMSVELILLAVNINLVAFSTFLGDIVGQVYALIVLTVAAAEAAIGLAILVAYFRNRGSIAVAAILFTLGILGIFLNRKNVIVILMSIELILLAVNINLVAFSAFLNDIVGQVFALLVLTVAAAEAAIGLAVLVVYFRNRGSIAVEDVNLMKG